MFSFPYLLRLTPLLDWQAVIMHRYHQEDLTQMIKAICTERRISKHGSTQYSWRLPLFNSIQWGNDNTLTADHTYAPRFCLLYKHETASCRWESILASSKSRAWTIGQNPLTQSDIKRLLDGRWLNDDIINAYLELCRYLQPDIHFLSTYWFSCLENWGKEAPSKLASWVSLLFLKILKICSPDAERSQNMRLTCLLP